MPISVQFRSRLTGFWIPDIYEDKVRSQRTRAVELPVPVRENRVEILHTLLGIEIKAGNRRITCPDLAAARYLRVFARLGCTSIAIPYDITQVSPLADELETAWQRTILTVESEAGEKDKRLRSSVVKEIRDAVNAIGAGERMPTFKQSTRQRPD